MLYRLAVRLPRLGSPKKILAIKLRALGDTVLMTAPLMELRKAYPKAEIHVVVNHLWAPLLVSHPAVDRVWPYERRGDRSARVKSITRLAIKLRKEKYDRVVNFHASPSSALLAYSTGARIRAIHFHELRKPRSYLSTVPIPNEGKLLPIIERDMDTVRALGVQSPQGLLPKLYFQPRELALAAQHLKDLGIGGEVLMIGLGSSRPTKSWPLDRFAEVSVGWCATQPKGSVLALAGPDDPGAAGRFLLEIEKVLTSRIASVEDRSRIRTRILGVGNLSVRELGATLSQAKVFLGNDSGPKHVAVAVGVPTVTLFGPEHPFEWHPYPIDRHPYFFTEGLSCRRDAAPGLPEWCALHDCIDEKHRCMKSIGSDQVLEACMRVAT